jgi:transketolase
MLKITAQKKEIRLGVGEGLVAAGEKYAQVVALAGDLAESTKFALFAKQYPQRFFQVGVAEQNMAGISAGLALSGKIPFMASFAVFNPGRNWDQIRVSIAYSKANVKIIGSHAGFSNAADGATHEGLEDIAITRTIPNLKVVVPADYIQAKKMIMAAASETGPIYMRSFKGETRILIEDDSPFEIGKAQIVKPGTDITIVSNGPILSQVIEAAENLASRYRINAEIINCHTVKPLDVETLYESALKTRRVLVVEEHQVIGGLGSAVAEMLVQHLPVPTKLMGVEDTFGESGTREQLLEKYGLSAIHIEMEAKNLYHK